MAITNTRRNKRFSALRGSFEQTSSDRHQAAGWVERLEPRRLLTTLYVDASAPGATQDGLSWAHAYLDLQPALAAAVSGDEIHVADGIYSPGAEMADTFRLVEGVQLIGGYAGYGAISPSARDVVSHPSVLTATVLNGGSPQLTYSVVTATGVSEETIIDGFTIQGTPHGNSFGDSAAGLTCRNASPTVQNCTFTSFTGSALQSSFSSPTLLDCKFSNNSGLYGGAIIDGFSQVTLTRCTFLENSSRSGNGGAIFSQLSQLLITQCTFTRNYTTRSSGGAIYSDGIAQIDHSIFNANTAGSTGDGGAIACTGELYIVNSSFIANRAGSSGGAISGAVNEVVLSTFTRNSASYRGGAVYSNRYSDVRGSIFWGDQAYYDNELGFTNSYYFANNDVQGSLSSSENGGNINADPLFVRAPSAGADGKWGSADDDYGNLQLQAYSPCIDNGGGTYNLTSQDLDLAGNSRVVDFRGIAGDGVDMGAYETPPALIALTGEYIPDGSQPMFRATFNGDVGTYSGSAFPLLNSSTGQTILPSSGQVTISYDPETFSVTWSFAPGLLPNGNYTVVLPAGTVSDPFNHPSLVSKPFNFFILTGDANRDRKVDAADLGIIAANWQGSGKTFCQGDFNYDGKVDIRDLTIFAGNWQQQLAAAPPPNTGVALATTSARTATRTPSRIISLVQ